MRNPADYGDITLSFHKTMSMEKKSKQVRLRIGTQGLADRYAADMTGGLCLGNIMFSRDKKSHARNILC